MDAVGVHAGVGHGGGYVVLGGQGVAAGEVDLGAPLPEDQAQIGGLGLQMDRDGDGQPGEGLFLAEPLLNSAEGGHEIPHPLDFLMARGGQGHVFYNTHGDPPYCNPLRGGFFILPILSYFSPEEKGGESMYFVHTLDVDFPGKNGYNKCYEFKS